MPSRRQRKRARRAHGIEQRLLARLNPVPQHRADTSAMRWWRRVPMDGKHIILRPGTDPLTWMLKQVYGDAMVQHLADEVSAFEALRMPEREYRREVLGTFTVELTQEMIDRATAKPEAFIEFANGSSIRFDRDDDDVLVDGTIAPPRLPGERVDVRQDG